MVRSLLPIVVGAMLGCSCLISNPPDYDTVGHRPAVDSRDPAGRIFEVDLNTDSPSSLIFQAAIWDGDVDDVLRHRCFLDYHPEALPRCGITDDYSIDATGEDLRTATCRPFRGHLSPGCHIVTMVITDGEWLCGEQTGCAGIVEGSGHGKRRLVVYRDHATYSPLANGNEIKVPLVIFVNEMVRAGIVVTRDLQDECPVEQAVYVGKLPGRFGKLEQVARPAGLSLLSGVS